MKALIILAAVLGLVGSVKLCGPSKLGLRINENIKRILEK